MQTRIWIVPPSGRLIAQIKQTLQHAGFTLSPLPDGTLPGDTPLFLLADLSDHPEEVMCRLDQLRQASSGDSLQLILVTTQSLAHLPKVAVDGLCAAWAEYEPVEQLVDRARGLLERYESLRRGHRLQAMIPLYSLAQSFADLQDLDVLLQQVLDTAMRETQADRGSIMLLNEEGNYLYIGAAVGLPERIIREQRQPVGEGIAGWVAQHREPLILTEGEIPPFALPWLRGRNAYSSISLPMIHQNHLLGVLNLTKQPGRPPFREGDVEFISILASQAAAFIHNARLFVRLQEAYRDLQQLDRLRTQIIDIAAHEMRTPVTVIKGYFELLRDAELPGIDTYLLPMERHLERLECLVRDLFDLTTLRALEREPSPTQVDVGKWLKACLAEHQEQANTKGIHLGGSVAKNGRTATFDPEHMKAILHHLLANAIKFAPRGGKVRVLVEKVQHALYVHVDDSGPGIPEEERQRVFADFYQVEEVSTRRHEGLGIGLSLARALAQTHGGTVEIGESPLGGARVSIIIPQ